VELATAIRLIEQGVVKMPTPQIWLDLGAGKGLFTIALASLLGSGSAVHAVDKDQRSLDAIKFKSSSATITKLRKDFVNENLDWEKWDGILMANALHFVSNPLAFLQKAKQNLRPNGRLIIVEYNTDTSNPWVPFPISFQSLRKLIRAAGLASVTLIDEEPSLFNRATIYSAVALLSP
jgi:2-polyprenyl-3-methyl-5-hydroxy-6-metoxy-1,4-benzoquinol methylase